MDTKLKEAFHEADEFMDSIEKLMELWVVGYVPIDDIEPNNTKEIAQTFYERHATMIESKIYSICKDKPQVMAAVILKNVMTSYIMDDVRKLIAESADRLFREDD